MIWGKIDICRCRSSRVKVGDRGFPELIPAVPVFGYAMRFDQKVDSGSRRSFSRSSITVETIELTDGFSR